MGCGNQWGVEEAPKPGHTTTSQAPPTKMVLHQPAWLPALDLGQLAPEAGIEVAVGSTWHSNAHTCLAVAN